MAVVLFKDKGRCKTRSSAHCPVSERKAISISSNICSLPGSSKGSIWCALIKMKQREEVMNLNSVLRSNEDARTQHWSFVYLYFRSACGLNQFCRRFTISTYCTRCSSAHRWSFRQRHGWGLYQKLRHEVWHIKIFNSTQPCMNLLCWHNRRVLCTQKKGSVISNAVEFTIVPSGMMYMPDLSAVTIWCPIWIISNKPTGNRDPALVLWKIPQKHDINALVHA